jgi:hypothetical protein
MKQQLRIAALFTALVFASAAHPSLDASARSCVSQARPYLLTSDTVDWSIQLPSGQSCVHSLRSGNVLLEGITLIASPKSGTLEFVGPGFRYKASSGFTGQDSFSVEVLGNAAKVRGSSTIRVIVSVINSHTASLSVTPAPTPNLTASPILAFSPTATPTPAPARPPSHDLANPNIGVNLEGVSDWARSAMFVDLMKSSRRWGSVATPWDERAATDPDGWPTQDAGIVVSTIGGPTPQDPTAPYMTAGTYKLSFAGKATVNTIASPGVAIRNVVYDAMSNTSAADVVVDTRAAQLFLTFTNTNGGVRAVQLLSPGYEGTNQTFTNQFIASLAPFSTLRFKDFLSIDNNPIGTWSDRTLPSHYSQAVPAGGAWEYVIELANLTGNDIWINVPVSADDDYITQLATLLKARLKPSIHVYVEFSNEVWNSLYSQTTTNMNQAVAEAEGGDTSLTGGTLCTAAMFASHTGNCNQWWAGYLRVAKQTVKISNLFAAVYGPSAINATIRPVLASQFSDVAIPERELKYIDTYNGAPSKFIYAVASAPYYVLDSATSTSAALTLDQIFASFAKSLQANVLPYFAVGASVNGTFKKGVAYNGGSWTGASYLALAHYYGIKSFAYEGGMDYLQNSNGLSVKLQSNFDPRTPQQMTQYFDQWYGCGNDLFMYFTEASIYGKWGYWGLTNDISNLSTPKMNSIKAISDSRASSFTTCN